MGWWKRGSGVVGDPVADYLESLRDTLGSIPWRRTEDIPDEVRERIAGFYLQDLGRLPTEEDLEELLEFVQVGI